MMLSCQLCDSKSGGLIIYATLKNTVCSWPIIRYKGRKHFYSDVSCTYNLLSISCRQSVQGNTLFCPNTASLWSKDIASDLVESSTFEWIHIKYRVHLQYMFTNKFNIYRAHISGRQTPGLTRCSSPAFVIQYRGGGGWWANTNKYVLRWNSSSKCALERVHYILSVMHSYLAIT
jgi:hypothetical protein